MWTMAIDVEEDADSIVGRLSEIVFRIEFSEQGEQFYGTGFFIDRQGYALTVFHNLPDAVRMNPAVPIKASFAGRAGRISLFWVPLETEGLNWQEEHDIAVLKADPWVVKDLKLLPLGFLPSNIAYRRRNRFWADRDVVLFGFPLRNDFDPEDIWGTIPHKLPINFTVLPESGREKRTTYTRGHLKIASDDLWSPDFQGMSGAPVYDRTSRMIVGVQSLQRSQVPRIYAVELAPLAENCPDAPFSIHKLCPECDGADPAPEGWRGVREWIRWVRDTLREGHRLFRFWFRAHTVHIAVAVAGTLILAALWWAALYQPVLQERSVTVIAADQNRMTVRVRTVYENSWLLPSAWLWIHAKLGWRDHAVVFRGEERRIDRRIFEVEMSAPQPAMKEEVQIRDGRGTIVTPKRGGANDVVR